MSKARDMASKTFWLPGEVIQTITLDVTAQTNQGTSANSMIDVSNMAITITPKKANSKIIIQMRWVGELNPTDASWNGVFGCSRNGTQINRTGTTSSGITPAALSYFAGDANSTLESASYFITDTPNTTSPLTYRVTWLTSTNGSIWTNRTFGNPGQDYETGTSAMIVTEIAQ